MVEFCKCGSMIINGSCSNKHCSTNLGKLLQAKAKKAGRAKATATAAVMSTTPKVSKVPKASKCITYHISELQPKEE
ncbi:hypothetical protein Cpap_3037 [Ruminiclostridium papyrosolvens DSM 2782]|uniref:Uncharacterized protein n=1 Tax=Ruminiclostridium papyrosolvens DSM 2782 TaxID=588581 RepID=F1TAS2_9FIRM|nr:hypothetical protein [Ruminiclostridium papyrosolvens]EGD48615.1 hypothetical protein Cpap_3037 [Ruminiclostridium papyrosolvens DSM 2782]WES32630.1 hypothetical protein P0092_12775 [Ruminiclostridium papyrosolvens DSM 2782]